MNSSHIQYVFNYQPLSQLPNIIQSINTQYIMIVQDVEIFPHTLKDIFSDPEKRQRILKIIIQTLYNLGLEKSATQLQRQSKIIYMTAHIKAIKEALPFQKYNEVQGILKANKLAMPDVMQVLNELKCMKMIREGNTEQTLSLIQEKFQNEEKRAKLAEELMMGTGEMSKEELKKKHDFIVGKCLECDICPHSMAKMINSYIQLEKQGLTKTISPQFSLLKKPTQCKNPPMRMTNVMTSSRVKNIVFLKFNKNADKLAVVSAHKKEKMISLWKVNKIDEQMIETHYSGMLTEEQVVGVSWNVNSGTQVLAVAFQTKILIFSVPELRVLHSKKLQMGRHIKILTIQWNPLTGFLHAGGSFESVKVFGSNLEQIMTIQPFFRTRKLCFNQEGTIMLGVSATKGKLISYSLFQQKQESCLNTDDIITSFRLENKDKNGIIVTQKRIIYIGINYDNPEQMFTILNSFTNPYGENGLVQIQAALFSPWLIFLGQQEFEAVSLEKDSKKIQKWNSKKSFTFDVNENLMVSGSKQIILWGSGSYQDAMQEEQQSIQEQQKENNGERQDLFQIQNFNYQPAEISLEISVNNEDQNQEDVQEDESEEEDNDDDEEILEEEDSEDDQNDLGWLQQQ